MIPLPVNPIVALSKVSYSYDIRLFMPAWIYMYIYIAVYAFINLETEMHKFTFC